MYMNCIWIHVLYYPYTHVPSVLTSNIYILPAYTYIAHIYTYASLSNTLFPLSLVAAAVLNPNPYFISRPQLKFVIAQHVPWMPADAVSRLASVYDPFHAGFIRYVRLSAAIIAGNRPSMSSLISSMNNGEWVRQERRESRERIEKGSLADGEYVFSFDTASYLSLLSISLSVDLSIST